MFGGHEVHLNTLKSHVVGETNQTPNDGTQKDRQL